VFPLTAIVGQEELVQALLITAVAPDVGGVLVRGQRGTAKSTAVRGLAPLLPGVIAAGEPPFAFAPGERSPEGVVPLSAPVSERPAPLVELPLGATLDRLVGSLDLGRALSGQHRFEPGLLARAHGGILYVDEVNLLPDHLVDALLDAAASRVARVERDAVSVEHDARFMLVGTMNVEEGELRPQLLDRFGLGVEVRGPQEPDVRAEIVRRRLEFERDPDGLRAQFAAHERQLAERIARARAQLDRVGLPERQLLRITRACASLNIDGVRGDIVWARAACALAALAGADEVDEEHVRRAGPLALAHRRHRDPLGDGQGAQDELERALDGEDPEPEPPDRPPPPGGGGTSPPPGGERHPSPTNGDPRPAPAPARERRDAPAPARLPAGALALEHTGRGPRGRSARAGGAEAGTIDSRPATGEADISIVASLRARLQAGPDGGDSTALREHVRSGRESLLLCLVVDASGSMGARRRLARVKGALLGVLRDAYARRDRVAIVAFRDGGAQVLVPPGAPLQAAAAAIRELPTGGRTPLAAGLDLASQLLRRETGREPNRRALAIVLTDGRVADPAGAARAAAQRLGRSAAAVHVIDTEEGAVRIGLAASLATAAGGQVHSLRSAA
jgi:magnesium chelatase subunit D